MRVLVIVGIPSAFFGLIFLAVRRFAAEQRRLGRWDAEGPLVETAPPPHAMLGFGMGERLEVSGQWHGDVLRDRRPAPGGGA